MGMEEARDAAILVDQHSVALYLEVPRSQVVLLQAYFDLYDGVATVRTLQSDRSVVCVLTTPSQLDTCLGVLHTVRAQVTWQVCHNVPPDPME
ncbi:MAG: hypothetical protein RL326_2143 [Pseudomonadota bacterium]|jgi:hypothetical protein